MKFKPDPKAGQYALYTLGVLCLAITFYFVLKNIGWLLGALQNFVSLISPFLMGFLFAYLLIRPLRRIENALERHVLRGRMKPGARRNLSILLVLLLAGAFLGVISSFVVPQLVQSLTTLTNSLPGYAKSLEALVTSLLSASGLGENLYEAALPYWESILNYLTNFLSQLAPWLINSSVALASKVMNLLVSFIVTIYLLSSKETFAMQLKKLCYALLPRRAVQALLEVTALVDRTFGGYINGQLLDALIVGTITTLSMLALRLPYALLIGVIVACTNVIPMIGPFIGAIPSTFIILMAGKPLQAVIFVVLILVIQQIDGNILVPKIIGDSTGLSGFWVLFAIMVAGGLFGIVGIAVCVPTLSVLFQLLKGWTVRRLTRKGLPTSTLAYGKGSQPSPCQCGEGKDAQAR